MNPIAVRSSVSNELNVDVSKKPSYQLLSFHDLSVIHCEMFCVEHFPQSKIPLQQMPSVCMRGVRLYKPMKETLRQKIAPARANIISLIITTTRWNAEPKSLPFASDPYEPVVPRETCPEKSPYCDSATPSTHLQSHPFLLGSSLDELELFVYYQIPILWADLLEIYSRAVAGLQCYRLYRYYYHHLLLLLIMLDDESSPPHYNEELLCWPQFSAPKSVLRAANSRIAKVATLTTMNPQLISSLE